jgi:hypothetical protein
VAAALKLRFQKTHHRRLTFTAWLCEVRRFHLTAETRRNTVCPTYGCGRFFVRTSSPQYIGSSDRLRVDQAMPWCVLPLTFEGPQPRTKPEPFEETPARGGARAHFCHAHLFSARTIHRAHHSSSAPLALRVQQQNTRLPSCHTQQRRNRVWEETNLRLRGFSRITLAVTWPPHLNSGFKKRTIGGSRSPRCYAKSEGFIKRPRPGAKPSARHVVAADS